MVISCLELCLYSMIIIIGSFHASPPISVSLSESRSSSRESGLVLLVSEVSLVLEGAVMVGHTATVLSSFMARDIVGGTNPTGTG